MNSDDRLLYEMFSAKPELPESVEKRIKETCAALPERHKTISVRLRGRSITVSRRMVIAAVAALLCVVFAGTALAAGLSHSGLFQTVLGSGKEISENDRIYYDSMGEAHEYPLFERTEVDEQAAELALGRYISRLDRTAEKDGCRVSLGDFVMDENGIGYLSYTFERAEGLDGYIRRYSGSFAALETDVPKELCPDIIVEGGYSADVYTVINEELSTEASAYLVDIFAVPSPLEGVTMKLAFGGETFELPTEQLVPVREMTTDDGTHRLEISPLGMTVEHIGHSEGSCEVDELSVLSGEDEYVVLSKQQNVENKYFSVSWGVSTSPDGPQFRNYDTVSYVFNRLVIPEAVTDVRLTAEMITHAVKPQSPVLHDPKTLAKPEENPFHYGRSDGVEVYVLTHDTVSGCTDEELKEYHAFTHGFATYDEFKASTEYLNENAFSRETMLKGCPVSWREGLMTAQEAIDCYIGLVESYYPEQLSRLRYVVLRLEWRENPDESGCVYGWRFVHTSTDAFFDMTINAQTGVPASPMIDGLNGAYDRQTGKFTYY